MTLALEWTLRMRHSLNRYRDRRGGHMYVCMCLPVYKTSAEAGLFLSFFLRMSLFL